MDQAQILSTIGTLVDAFIDIVAERAAAKAKQDKSTAPTESDEAMSADAVDAKINVALTQFMENKLDSLVESAIDDYDMSDKVSEAIDNHDFDSDIEGAVESYMGNYDFDETIRATLSGMELRADLTIR